jgi:hypothetical protein
MPKTDESVALLMVEQQLLAKAKLEKEKVSIAAHKAHVRGKLLQMCEQMVKSHPTWSKEKILKYFPEYEPIIDLVMEDEDEEED